MFRSLLLVCVLLCAAASPAFAGTPVCGTADDTAAIQALIDNNEPVLLPAGTCRVCELNGTDRQGLFIHGFYMHTKIVPICNGVNVIDTLGASHISLENFHLCGTCNPTIKPKSGILSGQRAATYTADANFMKNVRVDGYFTLAAWYDLQLASSGAAFVQLYNYEPGAITVIKTGNNFFGMTSNFVSINNANDKVSSDQTCLQCEIHNLGGGIALWIGGLSDFRYSGGNVSSSHTPIVSVNGVMISGTLALPQNLVFDGTTFYSDFAPVSGCAIQNNTGQPTTSILFLRANSHPAMPLTC